MDLNDIWTQNKRWILGVLVGALLFYVAGQIVQSIYDGRAAEAKVIGLTNKLRKQAYYDTKARKQAKETGEVLAQAQQRLEAELEFAPNDRFVLAGKGDADLHFDRVARDVRSELVDKAQQFSVELPASALRWTAPVGREEIERTLLGLDVLHTSLDRLLDAGEEVRSRSAFGALGLQSVEKFEVTHKKGRRSRGRFNRGGSRRRKSDDIDVSERVDEYEVAFKFRADAPTVQLFLERCRSQSPAVLLQDGFKFKSGRNSGDPLSVTGRLVGIIVREQQS